MLNILLHKSVECRQIEIPVINVLHYGRFAGKSTLRVDKVFGHILMSQVTFVGITLFGITAVNGTFTDNLPSI